MKIDLTEGLAPGSSLWQCSCTPQAGEISLRGISYPLVCREPFTVTTRRESPDLAVLTVQGSVSVSIPCDRCLRAVDNIFAIDAEYELTGREQEEHPFMDGRTLLLDCLIAQEVIVQWPGKVLCSQDCKGICPVCGADLNQGECGCDRHVPDPRIAAFQDVFDQFLKSHKD